MTSIQLHFCRYNVGWIGAKRNLPLLINNYKSVKKWKLEK